MAARKSPSDGLLVGGIALLLGATAAVWLAMELGGLYDHGYWPQASFGSAGAAIRHLVGRPADMAGAWPAAGTRVPSARTFYVTLCVLLGLLVTLLVAAGRAWLRRGARQAVRQQVRTDANQAVVTTVVTEELDAPPAPDAESSPSPGPAPEPPIEPAPITATNHTATAANGTNPEVASATALVAPPTPAPAMAAAPVSLADHLSAGTVLRRAHGIRATLTQPPADIHELAVALGAEAGSDAPLFGTLEDSYCVIGPPRSGKSGLFVNPAISHAPGAVLATCPRPDTVHATAPARQARGPVLVFDPQQLASWPAELRWSIERGCERPATALLRAAALVAGAGPWPDGPDETVGASRHTEGGDSEPLTDHGFDNFIADPTGDTAASAQAVLRCYLHALAIDGRPIRHALRWMADPGAEEPVRLLRESSLAADGWALELDALRAADARRQTRVWSAVRRALGALRDPRVLAACSPEQAERFDVPGFLRERGTLYLLGTPDGQPSVTPILTALAAEVVEHGRRLATRLPAGRLDPPTLLALDEVTALAPLPNLPELMASGGGLGLTPVVALRSWAQARARWGGAAVAALREAASFTIACGGLRALNDGGTATGSAVRGVGGELWALPHGDAALLPRGLPTARVRLPGAVNAAA